jgi:hypothetical protein
MTKCTTCGGTYNQVQADGTQYFHRCPPLSAFELDAAVKAGKVALPNGETVDIAVQRRTYERNLLRDENLPSTRASDAGKMKALGAGTSTVADPSTPVVVVGP